jgi:hypothetical protein
MGTAGAAVVVRWARRHPDEDCGERQHARQSEGEYPGLPPRPLGPDRHPRREPAQSEQRADRDEPSDRGSIEDNEHAHAYRYDRCASRPAGYRGRERT